MKRTNRIAGILLNAVACGISATVIFPLIWMAYSSVKPNPEFMQNTLALPRTVMLSNYAEAFEIGKLGTAVLNSLFYSRHKCYHCSNIIYYNGIFSRQI